MNKPVGYFKEGGKTKPITSRKSGSSKMSKSTSSIGGKDVARIILEQLGGRRFSVMTGAKNFVNTGDGLSMKIGRNKTNSNYLKITLNEMDTYDMEFAKVTKWGDKKSVTKYKDVYNDMLRPVFTEHTGMYTSLSG